MTFKIERSIRQDDARSIATWLNNDFDHFLWTANEFKKEETEVNILKQTEDPTVSTYLLRDGMQALAYAEIHQVDKESHWFRLVRLVTNNNFRSHGYGKKLLEIIEDDVFKNKGAIRYDLIVFTENKSAINLYIDQKFKNEGTMMKCRVYNNKWQDLYIFAKIKD